MEVAKIKKALKCWQESVMLSTDENYVSHKVYNREILDYINELESENEKLKNIGLNENITVGEYLREMQRLKDRVAELEKEKTEQLKQFVEMLKEKADGICVKNDILYAIKSSDIDEVLKEFL